MLGAGILLSAATAAQEVPAGTVVVSANRTGQDRFDAPASIDAVAVDPLRLAAPLVNLSELTATVPGLQVRERQNYAQDLQISARGFGTRSTFGVRGVRILVDGLPATMPDGQGQAASAALGSATRIEVLRGPVAQLYGNAAGGVVQVFTADPPLAPAAPVAVLSAGAGSDGQHQLGFTVGAGSATVGFSLDAMHYETDGYRQHSAARRSQANAKLVWKAGPGTRVTAILNLLDQPLAQDPLGLTHAQFDADPRQVAAVANTFDTRKTNRQQQFGVVLEHRLGDDDTLGARAYGGMRSVFQTLALSGSAANSAGGVVDLDNTFRGAALSWSHVARTASGPLRLTLGLETDLLDQVRRGFVNNNGRAGALRRDETDRASNTDVFGQVDWRFAPHWSASAGVRSTRVKLSVDDRYVTAASPDDSGAVDFSSTSPVAGIVWHASEAFNVYANLGRGFETPTLTEVAYRPGATGPNLGLRASTSRQGELGMKWRSGRQSAEVALFDARSSDEIVPSATENGRSIYQNVDSVGRRGIEAAWRIDLGSVQARAAWTLLDASFGRAFVSGQNGTVAAGNRLPGAPRQSLAASLDWRPADGVTLGADLRAEDRVAVDDLNSDFAPGYAVLNLRAGRAWQLGASTAWLYARIDNAFDRRYAGSVIVNDGNRRFFEPAPGRRFFVGLRAAL